MSLYNRPPESISIDGAEYPINTDFRVWIQFHGILSGGERDGEKADRLAGFMTGLGLPSSDKALDSMLAFFAAESQEKPVAVQRSRPAAFDFQKDSEYIYAAFMSTYGVDLNTAALHWWNFKAMFKALPDNCEFCKIMHYRTADLKNVPKDQRRFYQEQKARYSLGEKAVYRTERDMRDYAKRRFEEAKSQMSALRSDGQPDTSGQTSSIQ